VKFGITKRIVSLRDLAPVIPLGAMIMAAGYANEIYKVRTVSDEHRPPDIFPLRFNVDILCNVVNGHVMCATVV
jgi:hypothetical protein